MKEKELENVWAHIMAEDRPHRIVPFPRNNPETKEPYCSLAIVILTAEESSSITASAEKKIRQVLKENIPGKNEKSQGYEELFKTFCAEGILFRACKNANDLKKPFFPTINSISEVLTVDEIGVLLNHYYDVAISLGPVIGELTPEESDIWMNRLMNEGTQPRFLLNSFSVVALKDLLMFLVSHLKNLQTSKS